MMHNENDKEQIRVNHMRPHLPGPLLQSRGESQRALIGLLLIASLTINAIAAGELPTLRHYRDLKVYSTSAPDKNQPARIVAQTQFINEGPIPLRINARLDSCNTLSFKGAQFDATLPPGKSNV